MLGGIYYDEFEKELASFNYKYEEQIRKHIDANAFTDRRFLGSLLGMGVFGGVGFVVFSGAITFGIGGCRYLINGYWCIF